MRRPELVRFHDLTSRHVNRDLQVHTVATDGQATIGEIVRRGEELGLAEIAFTEHVRRDSAYFPEFATEVRRTQRDTEVRLFVGVETKAQDDAGTLDVSPEVLAEADIVLGSVHRFPVGQARFVGAREFPYVEAVRREFELALGLLRAGPIDVLAHPGGMCQRAFGQFPTELFEALMCASLERGIAIEINTSYTRDLDAFLAVCAKVNPIVSIGSDAHTLDQLGACRGALVKRGIGCQ